MNLSEHFSYAEMTVSQAAARAGISNAPSVVHLDNLRRLCASLESIRLALGVPLIVTSGYRSPAVNKLIGGSKTSAHMQGLAADLIAPALGSPLDLAQAIAAMSLRYDQVIHEFDSWCHFGLAPAKGAGRREILTIDSQGLRRGLLPARQPSTLRPA